MDGRATKLRLLTLSSTPMRVFHLSWMAFFVCSFAWFAVAPLMPVIREDLGLSHEQIANINIAAVLITILVRLAIGPLCDRYGARLTYTWLLALGAIPVIAIGFAVRRAPTGGSSARLHSASVIGRLLPTSTRTRSSWNTLRCRASTITAPARSTSAVSRT